MVKKLPAPFYERLSLVLIGLLSLGFLIIQGKELLDPMMFGFLFALLLLPVSNFFERKCRLPRSIAAFLSITLMVLFITGIVYLVGTQISILTNDWPLLKNQLSQTSNDIQHWISHTFHYNMAKQSVYIQKTTN